MAEKSARSARRKGSGAQRGHARELHATRDRRSRSKGPGHWFAHAARRVSNVAGSPFGFLGAVSVIVLWAVSGPIFGFSDTWQLVINTGTTIVTFLMVFLIQNTQNRDAAALHLKLDELLRAVPGARNEYMESEEEDMDEILREKAEVDRADPKPPQK